MNPVRSASGVEPGPGPPVNPVLGAQVLADEEDLDFVVEGPLPLAWQRTYRSTNEQAGWFGPGWSSPLEVSLEVVPDPGGRAIERIECVDVFGRRIPFDPVAPGASRLSAEEGVTLARTHEGRYAINAGDGLRYVFGDRLGLVHRLAALEDRNGNRIGLTYPDAGADVSAGVRGVDETIHVDCSGGQRLALVIRRSRLCEVVELRAAPAATVRLARYAYTANGDLHEVFNRADERMRVFDCDAQHRIRHQVHAGSFESWVEYLGAGAGSKVVRHWDNTGESWTFEYRAIDTRVTDGSGRVSLYHVDARRRWIGYTDPLGRLTRFGLDRQGNVRSVVDPAQNVTETVFDERNRPVEVREADGAVTRIEWHAELDLPVAVVDALGGTQRFEYDARGNLVAEVDACGAETRYQRDERGLAVAITDARGGVATLSHDARGLPLRVTDCSGSETRYVYDDDGWLRGVVDELGRPTTYDYDAAGRLRRETLADGSFTEWESDLADRPLRTTDALGHTHRFRYAPDGLLVEQVDPLGHVLACRYGPGRQLVELVNENGARYRFEYDAADQLVGQSRFDGGVTRYEHDAARRIVRMVEAPGTPEAIVTHYRRDAMGRLLERRTDTRRTVLRYDVAGRIVEAHDGTVGVRIEHDAVGRVVGEAVAAPGWRYALRHVHDPLGNRLSTRLQDGTTIEALHYGSGHVHQIRLDDRPLTDFERDAAHQEVSRTQGRLVTTRRHDAVGRLRRQSTRFAPAAGPRVPDRRAGASVIQRRYRYDLAGRLVLAMDRGRRLTYGHDALDRLTRFCDEHFVFDPAHNLQPAGDARVVPDNLVKTFGPYRYRHDAHGRVVEKRVGDVVIRLAWNDDHRLVESTRQDAGGAYATTYLYDPFGRRIAKQGPAGASWFAWSEETLLRERRDHVDHTFVHAPGGFEPLAQAVAPAAVDRAGPAPAPRVYHYHCDQIGLPRELTDADGRIVWEGRYAGWGRLLDERFDPGPAAAAAGDPPPLSNLRLQGQYFDVETGLHYNFNRYYDPDCGRYLSRDSIGLAGGPNEHLYVIDPAGWIDPLGLTGTYIMSGGKNRNYIGKGPKVRSQASRRARLAGCQKQAVVHEDYGDDDMGFMVEHLLMEKYKARISKSWANSTRLDSPGKKKYNSANAKVKKKAEANARKLRRKFNAEKKACGL